jgi:hydroxyethylthiazole kinase-like uncharacterized protein yjeF
MKIASVKEIRMLDKKAEEFGLKSEILMENAGNAAFYAIEKEMHGVEEKKFVVFAGTGNNGGDGFVVARKLASSGASVSLFLLGDPAKIRGAALENYNRLNSFPIERYTIKFFDRITEMNIFRCDAIIDAIFGIGISREIKGIYKEIIEGINISGKTVFSIDIPSGINGDTGEIMGTAVKANYTITFGLPKRGLFIYPGADFTGKLYISHISYPPSLYNSEDIKVQINIPIKIPERENDTHKGNFGKALFVSGGGNYLGAPYFSSMAFLKTGGGLSYLATPKSLSPFIVSKASEVVALPMDETNEKTLSLKSLQKILEFTEKVDIVSIGSGITLDEETQELSREIIKNTNKPIIIDGDGLTSISKNKEIIKNRTAPTILTPHLGEFSRLVDKSISEIKLKKIEFLQQYAEELNAVIILKGAFTLIGLPDKRVFVNTSGNPGMATAGSGDVLTGTIAAMYGIGLSIEGATRTGTFLHGLAGDLLINSIGQDGITATEILNNLPKAVKYYRENYKSIRRNAYERAYII